MRHIRYRPYIFLALFLFMLLTLPERTTLSMRQAAVSAIAPSWRLLSQLKRGVLHLLMIAPAGAKVESSELVTENETLKQENLMLRTQLANVREWLLQEERLDEQMQRWKMLLHQDAERSELKEYFERRAHYLMECLHLQLGALPAEVVFREPTSWSSFLWLNVGERDNRTLNRKIVAKNSPVVIGTSLVGLVEEVGDQQCKVRLITDAGLVPAVRAVRGMEQNRFLLEHLDGLLLGVATRSDLFASTADAQGVLALLTKLRDYLGIESDDHFLAKGELHGTSRPLWRSRDLILQGVGFNYDYEDEEGPARDLRTGIAAGSKKKAMQLVQAGDLLMTTGMDGVFPAGLRVAVVSEVIPLKEGACTYDLKAQAVCGDLSYLSHLTVLPPIGFEK